MGIVTGAASGGLLVLDVDNKNGKDGMASLLKLTRGEEPDTLKVRTPSGGVHYYFRTDQTVRNAAGFLKGLDIRGDGGYIVAPPSIIDGVEYVWLSDPDAEIAAVPDWLHQAIADRHSSEEQEKHSDLVPVGQRNESFFKKASELRDQGLSQEQVLTAVSEQNQRLTEEPLDGKEVETVVASAFSYPSIPGKESFTDIANAGYLVQEFGKDIRYVTEFSQFILWRDGYWKPDGGDIQTLGCAKEAARRMMSAVAELEQTHSPRACVEARQQALHVQQAARLKAMWK